MLKENSISFISCVNDEELYSRCLQYIHALEVPDDFEYKTIAVRNASSMTSGYNEAMQKSDSKYKVYLHQDTFIVNKKFIQCFLDVFNQSNKIGMIGMVGTTKIPLNGKWRSKAKYCYGKVMENSMSRDHTLQIFLANEVRDRYMLVKAIDGLMMITQYDVQWRDDIFDGWHFYDISQCMEFAAKGYQVCVPRQESYWSIHDCGEVNYGNYDQYYRVFMDEYASKVTMFGKYAIMFYRWNKKLRPVLKKIEALFK